MSVQVLVACFDAEKRASLADILIQCGLDPFVATDLDGVRSILAQTHIHVVFCEVDLFPGGFREVLRLARTEPATSVVVCSLLGDLDEYLGAMQLGAFDFIAPPYRRAEVESIVNSVRRDCLPKETRGTLLYFQAGAFPLTKSQPKAGRV